MALVRWLGGAAAVAQVTTITLTAYDVTTTYKITINNKVVSVIGQGGTTATTAAALLTVLQASTYPEFLEVTWSVNSNVITGTAASAGVPFTVTSSVSGGAGTIGAATTTTASAGPHDWSTAANWSTNTVPVSTDDVMIDLPDQILYGLAQSAVNLNTLTINPGFAAAGSAQLGNYNINTSGASSYPEYRSVYLQISVTNAVTINTDCQLMRINFGSAVVSNVTVLGTGVGIETNYEALLLLTTNSGSIWNIISGSVGIAVGNQPTALNTLRLDGGATVRIGNGVTLSTVNIAGGTLVCSSSIGSTCTLEGGSLTMFGTASVNTLTLDGGAACTYWSSGTITTLNVGNGSAMSFSPDVSRTVTTVHLYAGASINDRARTVTWTNPVELDRCGLLDVSLDLGRNIKLAVTDF